MLFNLVRSAYSINLFFPLIEPYLAFEDLLQQQRVQRRLVRATAHMRTELRERVADEEKLAIEEHRARGSDARYAGDMVIPDRVHETVARLDAAVVAGNSVAGNR